MKYIIATVTIVFIFAPFILLAQGPGGGSSLPGDPGVPIDGGASLLLGASVLYGVRKLKGRKDNLK